MNIQSPINCSKLSAIILLELFALCPARAVTVDEASMSLSHISILAFEVKQVAYQLDGSDAMFTTDIFESAADPLCELRQIEELSWIESLLHDVSGKATIKSVINDHLDSLAKSVDSSVQLINNFTPLLHSKAATSAAIKLRDALRDLKHLRKPVP